MSPHPDVETARIAAESKVVVRFILSSREEVGQVEIRKIGEVSLVSSIIVKE